MSGRLPPMRLLAVFETVLRRGGVGQAAAELNVSQPAVSQALRQLEDHLGARLLDRSRRPATLTIAGEILHKATIESMARIGDAVAEIEHLARQSGQAITIAAPIGFATQWLMPRLASLYSEHPELAVSVMTTPSGSTQLSSGVNIVIRYGRGGWRDGSVHHLYDEEIVPVCSPAVACQISEAGGRLDVVPLVHVDVADTTWMGWPEYLRATKQKISTVHPGLRFTNYVQAAQAASHDRGLMLGWHSVTGDLVRAGSLVRVVAVPHVPKEAFYAVIADPPRAPESTDSILQWLKHEAAKTTAAWSKKQE
jgi:LysR family glycine cleavage system transcriptional activator